jgi:hypothetical protein
MEEFKSVRISNQIKMHAHIKSGQNACAHKIKMHAHEMLISKLLDALILKDHKTQA